MTIISGVTNSISRSTDDSTDDKKNSVRDNIVIGMVVIIPSIALTIVLHYWEIQNYLYWITVISIIVCQAYNTLFVFSFIFESFVLDKFYPIIENIFIFGIIVPFIGSLIITPVAIINHNMENELIEKQIVDITEIEDNFDRIKKTMENLELNLKKETNDIALVSNNILKQIVKKKEQLDAMGKKQISLQKEVYYYKQLANLSKEDARLILKVIRDNQNRGKYFEYILGFIFGVFGSVIANFIYKIIDKKLSQP